MSAERYRKNRNNGGIPPCRMCMHPARVKPPKDSDFRCWLEFAGVFLAEDESPVEWVRQNGVPELLAEIMVEMGLVVHGPIYRVV